jgi:TolB-like protein/Tfp pilus assembly protein PilF
LRRNPTTAVAVAALIALAGIIGPVVWQSKAPRPPAATGIAVLPFENSGNKEDTFFADGVQDDILTKLAKTDLKVISRTSVMTYRGAHNTRQIGEALRVSHVLEGSVRRNAGRIHLNTQLIDTRTDTQVWAEQYDRDLNDMFAIQGEIAQKVAEQLHAKVSLSAKRSIELPPTTDLAAFDLYTRAKTLLLTIYFSVTSDQNARQAIELLDQAVARDPAFFEAYYQLVFVHGFMYANLNDRTPTRLALAEAALQAATRLRPNAGETHLARATYLYFGQRDYDSALDELAKARPTLPNDPRICELTGYILRRHAQQEGGLRQLERAAELDPRNFVILVQIALSNQFLRRYSEEVAALDRALDVIPTDAATQGIRARVDFYWKADTRSLRQTIEAILTRNPGAISEAADSWFVCALADRDAVAAERALVAIGDNICWEDDSIKLSRSFGEGLLARLLKDEARAQTAFTKARLEQEEMVRARPDYGPALCMLGLIDAALGRKEEALREGRRAIELLPVELDSMNGSRMRVYFAIIAAWVGEKEIALQQLPAAVHAEGGDMVANYGALKLLPFWDPLRGDPRFEKIVESLAPK